MTRPNPRTQQIGNWLTGVVAQRVTDALDHLNREQHILDGWTAKGDSAGRGNGDNSTTEAAVLSRLALTHQTDDIRDAIDGLSIAADHLARMATQGVKLRAPEPAQIPRCRDGQTGREGTIEWGDPTCLDIPIKARLCSACYQRERRWRVAHNLEPRDVEPAA